MEGIWGDHLARDFELKTKASDLSRLYDLILITVKSYDTKRVVREVVSSLKPEGIAVSLQNGLGNIESLADSFGARRSLGASVLVGARISEPGKVRVTVQAAPVIIGPLDSSSEAMEKSRYWAAIFNRAGISCQATDQILSYIWAKVFYNAPLNALGALLQVHYGALGEEPELKAIMDRVIDEAFRVAGKKRVKLLWKSVEAYQELFYKELLPATYDHQSSMLQDLERGRATEIDAINGRIWSYGREIGLPTPYNEVMTRLIWGREKRKMAKDSLSVIKEKA